VTHTKVDAVIEEIRTGYADKDLSRLQEAITARREQLKEVILEKVREVFGEDATVITRQAAPVQADGGAVPGAIVAVDPMSEDDELPTFGADFVAERGGVGGGVAPATADTDIEEGDSPNMRAALDQMGSGSQGHGIENMGAVIGQPDDDVGTGKAL
jgi:hypothetical protein